MQGRNGESALIRLTSPHSTADPQQDLLDGKQYMTLPISHLFMWKTLAAYLARN
jgi:hypothetical protein